VHIAAGGGFISIRVVSGLPERYSATARRSSLDSVIAIVIIEPFSSASRICSGAIAANAARVGARGTPRVVAHGASALIGRRAGWRSGRRLRGDAGSDKGRAREERGADKLMRCHEDPLNGNV
jgi:hypothetical protein